jgi:gliding motility-associated-like protein
MILLVGLSVTTSIYGQCSRIGDNGSDQITSGFCAPVTLQMPVSYAFDVSVDPSKIQILYNWGDGSPDTLVTPGAFNGNKLFMDTITHVYPQTGPDCSYTATAYVVYDGDHCTSSSQTQSFRSWNIDNQNGAYLATDPAIARFCEGETVYQIFADASFFNCNILVEHDKPNQEARWVQFVYGTNTNPGDRIPNIEVTDTAGVVHSLTDLAGNSLGTLAGPVKMIPFEANGPNQSTYPIAAPPGGVAGDIFEITLRNWNACNPYDNDPNDGIPPADPINGDNPPIEITALIEIITTPPLISEPKQDFCSGDDITLNVAGTKVRWYSDSLLTTLLHTGNSFNPAGSPTWVDPDLPGTQTYWVTDAIGDCESAPSKVEMEIFASPGGADAGKNKAVCGDQATLDGNAPVAGAGQWTTTGNAVISDPTDPHAHVTNLDPGANHFSWTLTNGPCMSTDNVTIYSDEQPDSAFAGTDSDLCNLSTATMQADNPTLNGEGTWSLLNGNANILNAHDPQTTVTNLSPGENTFFWEVASEHGGCPATSDTVIVLRDIQPDDAYAGPDRNICDATTVTLTGNRPTDNGAGSWSVISGSAVISSPSDSASNASNLIQGINSFRWTISSEYGICPATSDTVHINMAITPDASQTGPDQALCSTLSSNALGANPASIGTGTWWVIDGPSATSPSFIPSVNDPDAVMNITPGNEGLYQIAWTIANGSCATSDTMTVDFGLPPSPADAGPDIEICGNSITLAATTPDTGWGTWTQISGTGPVSFEPDIHTPSATVSVNNGDEGTYLLEWRIRSGSCSIFPKNIDTVKIVFKVTPAVPQVDDVERCDTGRVELQALPGANGAETRWYDAPTGGVLLYTGEDFETPISGATTSYFVSTYNSTTQCESPREEAKAIIHPVPALPVVQDVSVCGPQDITLTGSPGINGTTLRWYADSSLRYTGTNYHPGILDSTTTYQVSDYNASTGCESDPVPVTVTVLPLPAVPLFADTSSCGPASFILRATAGTNATGIRWYNAQSGGTLLATTDSLMTSTLNTSTTYWVSSYNDTTGCESRREDYLAVIHPVPADPAAGNLENCGPDTLSFIAILGSNSTTSHWYADMNGDSLLANANSWTQYVDTDKLFFVSSYNDSTRCESGLIPVTATIRPVPATTPIQGATQVAINQTNVIYAVDYHAGSIYHWDIPDSVNLILQNKNIVILEFPNIGLYTIELTETGANGCPGPEVTKDIFVSENAIVVDLQMPSDEFCTGNSVRLNAIPTGGTPSYKFIWEGDTGNLDKVTVSDPVFSSSQPGVYHLKVTVVDVNGYKGSDSVTLTVNPSPVTDILLPDTTICGGTDLSITTSTVGGSGNYVSYLWKGNTAPLSPVNQPAPVFNSLHDSTFKLIYQVTDDKGCSAQDSVYITTHLPQAAFTSDALPACSPEQVNFTDHSSEAVKWEWDFDDGTGSTGQFTSHTFTNTSSSVTYFNVSLTVTDQYGCSNSSGEYITVYPNGGHFIAVNPDTACSPYLATVSATPGGFMYNWDFGDGNQMSGSYNAAHMYEYNGRGDTTYTITLAATSFFGCTDTTFAPVTVYASPKAAFTATPATQMYPESTVQLNNLTNEGAWSYMWYYGDDKYSKEQDPGSHTYSDRGNYTISLYVKGEYCSDSATQSIKITPHPPVAEFSKVEPGCMPLTIHFQNKSSYSDSYLWEFGDGSVSNKPNPTYTYYESGTYKIKLTATGPGGTDIHSQVNDVYILPNSYFDLAPRQVYVNDEAVHYFNLSDNGDVFEWDFGDGETTTEFNPTHVYKKEGTYDVTLKVWTSHDCFDLYVMQNAVIVKPTGKVVYPNVFSPLSQIEENRVFYPGIIDNVLEYHLMIFNRWGDMVFESFDQDKGWDGYYNGEPAKQDVYVWKVAGKYSDGKNFVKTGDVTLLY